MKQAVLGILAHVDAGKTTLSEQLLFHSGALRHAGRVDNGDACLDFDAIERRRGVTIYTAQASFCWGDACFHLLDTPGHPDFSASLERALAVLACAVLVVSAIDGVQAHTQTIWQLLRARNIPTVIFLNKIDRPNADIPSALASLSALDADCVPWMQIISLTEMMIF